MLGHILIVLVVLILIGALARWPHRANWGIALEVD
jgi:hypothetical protein